MSDRRGDRNRGTGRDTYKSTRDDRHKDDRGGQKRNDSARRNDGGGRRNGHGDDYGDKRDRQAFSGNQKRDIQFSNEGFNERLVSELPKKKFTGRCRLFVGNLPNDVKDEELKKLFQPHGEISECYMSGKGFAFIRLDTRAHAEAAKETLDGTSLKGRPIRVRFAVHGAAVRVKELTPTVSNEMLYHAFSHFGEVERAVHIVDDKGRPTCEAIIEFERKNQAMDTIREIRDRVFLINSCPKPLVCDQLNPTDEDDGLSEKTIPKTPQLQKERELGPRFAVPSSFEHVYGMKWKELYEVEKQRRAQLEEELKESRRRLEADMELAYQDYQAQMLREDLQRRQQELERLEAARRDRVAAMGGRNQMSGPPPHLGGQNINAFMNSPFNVPSLSSVPPPMQQQMQPQQGQNPQGGHRPNVIEGVQRLLQIFKTDETTGRGNPLQNHMQQQGNFQQGFNRGGGNAFQQDFPPPLKRERR